MKQTTLEMGGVEFKLKAHAACAHCTECEDFQEYAESTNLKEFEEAAKVHFRKRGWRGFEPNRPTTCPTCSRRYVEKTARQLKVGDVIVAKQGDKTRFTITGIMPGLGAGPYLTLKKANGHTAEHETAFDSRDATYTVDTDPNA